MYSYTHTSKKYEYLIWVINLQILWDFDLCPFSTEEIRDPVVCHISQGFGVAAKSTQECRRVDPMSIVVFHQADVGEFIRNEDNLT